MSTLTIHFKWADQVVRARDGHMPLHWELEKKQLHTRISLSLSVLYCIVFKYFLWVSSG